MTVLRLMVFFLLALTAFSVFASGSLVVTLRYPVDQAGGRRDGGGGKVEVVLTNHGSGPVDVATDSIPDLTDSGLLVQNVFEVMDEGGAKARYTGLDMLFDYVEPPYMTVQPHESRIVEADIGINYELMPGRKYEVQLRPVRYLKHPRGTYGDMSAQEISGWLSEARPPVSLVLWADPRLQKGDEEDRGD